MTKTALKVALDMSDKLPTYVVEGLRSPHLTQKVRSFHMFYGAPIGPAGCTDREFRHMSDEDVARRLRFINEELKELYLQGFGIIADITLQAKTDAMNQSAEIRFDDTQMVDALKRARQLGHKRNGGKVADALGDLEYFETGFMVEMGYSIDDALFEIHASNMTKPDENGQPIIADGSNPEVPKGKVLKGPNYVEPQIDEVLGLAG